MLKILQARLQPYMNCGLPDVQAGFRKGRGTKDQIGNICWIVGKARESQENIYFCFIDYIKSFDCMDHNKLWKILQEIRWKYQITWPASWEICIKIRKQELELDMEQQTGSKLGKEYVKAVYCHPACLTYMQSKYIMRYAGMDEAHAGINTAGSNINNLIYIDDTTLMAESEEELKIPLSWQKVKKN